MMPKFCTFSIIQILPFRNTFNHVTSLDIEKVANVFSLNNMNVGFTFSFLYLFIGQSEKV